MEKINFEKLIKSLDDAITNNLSYIRTFKCLGDVNFIITKYSNLSYFVVYVTDKNDKVLCIHDMLDAQEVVTLLKTHHTTDVTLKG